MYYASKNRILPQKLIDCLKKLDFCGISRRMRDPYEKAAAFYHERSHQGNETIDRIHVKFAAIDCFYHEGQCRKSYKLNYFPHMLLYVKGTRGYQYFGPTIKTNLIDFIENIRMPVIRLVNLNDFYEFLVQHEVKQEEVHVFTICFWSI